MLQLIKENSLQKSIRRVQGFLLAVFVLTILKSYQLIALELLKTQTQNCASSDTMKDKYLDVYYEPNLWNLILWQAQANYTLSIPPTGELCMVVKKSFLRVAKYQNIVLYKSESAVVHSVDLSMFVYPEVHGYICLINRKIDWCQLQLYIMFTVRTY